MPDGYSATGAPKFVMVGADLPDGRCRLYASRDLPPGAAEWALADKGYGPTAWHISTDMPNCLITDAPTWGQAFGRVFEIWENHDREKRGQAEVDSRTDRALGKNSPDTESALARGYVNKDIPMLVEAAVTQRVTTGSGCFTSTDTRYTSEGTVTVISRYQAIRDTGGAATGWECTQRDCTLDGEPVRYPESQALASRAGIPVPNRLEWADGRDTAT